jgi:hypothetical protein
MIAIHRRLAVQSNNYFVAVLNHLFIRVIYTHIWYYHIVHALVGCTCTAVTGIDYT